VLVRHIRSFLDDFIGNFQSSFIPNRGTYDNAIIAQEIVHCMPRKGASFSHLLFADDCFLFAKAKSSQVKLV
jgi:hypothetical protein